MGSVQEQSTPEHVSTQGTLGRRLVLLGFCAVSRAVPLASGFRRVSLFSAVSRGFSAFSFRFAPFVPFVRLALVRTVSARARLELLQVQPSTFSAVALGRRIQSGPCVVQSQNGGIGY